MTAHGGASGRQVRDSEVEGAGLGLFALKDLESGTILGSYPGRKWPQQLWLNRKSGGDKDAQAKARTYVWLLVSTRWPEKCSPLIGALLTKFLKRDKSLHA